MESNTLSIGGIWLNESKAGKKYMKGSIRPYKIEEAPKEVQDALAVLTGYDVLVFKNDKKEEGSSAPDYRLCISEPRKKESQAVEDTFGSDKSEDDVPF